VSYCPHQIKDDKFKRVIHKIDYKNLKERGYFGVLIIDGRIILKLAKIRIGFW